MAPIVNQLTSGVTNCYPVDGAVLRFGSHDAPLTMDTFAGLRIIEHGVLAVACSTSKSLASEASQWRCSAANLFRSFILISRVL